MSAAGRRGHSAAGEVLVRGTDTIPNTPNCMDQRIHLPIVYFAPNAPNIDVNDIGRGVEMNIPDMLPQHRPWNYAAFVTNQIFQELELSRQQFDFAIAAAHCSRHQIHFEITDAQNCFLDDGCAASGKSLN